MNYVPFVYLLKFKPTGELYYGVRFTEKEIPPAHPDQLGTTYFTSSSVVKDLIKEHGKDSFEYEVRKTFKTAAEARRYERRVLRRINAKKNPMFLNKSNGGGSGFGRSGPHTEDSISKIKATKNAKTQDEKDAIGVKISAKMKGKKRGKQSQETIDKRAATRNAKSQEELDAIYAKVRVTMNGKSQEELDAISAKISTANTGSKRDDEARAKMSVSAKGKNKSQEHGANISKAKTGKKRPFTDEHRANMSLSKRKRDAVALEKKVTQSTRHPWNPL